MDSNPVYIKANEMRSTEFNFTFYTGREDDDKAFEEDGTTYDSSKALFSGIDNTVESTHKM